MLKYNKKIKKIKLQFLKNKSLSSCVKLDKKAFLIHLKTLKLFKVREPILNNIFAIVTSYTFGHLKSNGLGNRNKTKQKIGLSKVEP